MPHQRRTWVRCTDSQACGTDIPQREPSVGRIATRTTAQSRPARWLVRKALPQETLLWETLLQRALGGKTALQGKLER